MKYRENIEQPSRYWDKKKLTVAGGAIAVASLYVGGVAYLGETDPVNQYNENFTDSGKCLDNTPYDEDDDAVIDTINVDGRTVVVRVMPKDANSHDPSVLFITETDQGWYGFGDNQTGTFLVSQSCENIPNGY